mmetsp:Transcript_138558/g.345600  ORF Transcript_138558/g.345600 Transcript_138558/m.345600 type:complete len:203 (-) Transcript_138558:287-895(-)
MRLLQKQGHQFLVARARAEHLAANEGCLRLAASLKQHSRDLGPAAHVADDAVAQRRRRSAATQERREEAHGVLPRLEVQGPEVRQQPRRQVCGKDACEQLLPSLASVHGTRPLLARGEFVSTGDHRLCWWLRGLRLLLGKSRGHIGCVLHADAGLEEERGEVRGTAFSSVGAGEVRQPPALPERQRRCWAGRLFFLLGRGGA